MSARRIQSLHHNLGEKNVVFHREHRSKKGRKIRTRDWYLAKIFKKKREQEVLQTYE